MENGTKRTLELPREQPTNSNRRRVFLVWILVFGIVAIANLLAILILNHVAPNEASDRIRIKWNLVQEKQPVDWLILGDSSAHHGLNPALFPAIHGGRRLNCGTVGQLLTANDAWLLEQCITSSGPPARVVIMRCYLDWEHVWEPTAVAKIPRSLSWLKRADPPLAMSSSELKDFLLTRYFPLYGQNLSVGFMVKYPWKNFERSTSGELRNGFVSNYKPQLLQTRMEAAALGKALENQRSFKIDAINRAGLEAICRLAQKYHFPVYFLNSPVVESIYRHPAYRKDISVVTAYLKQLSSRYPNFKYIATPIPAYPAERMQNPVHLAGGAVPDFTEAVVREIEATPKRDPK